MPFDANSGLVFSEAKVRHSPYPRERSTRCIGTPPARRSNGRGSGSLVDVALRRLLCSLEELGSDALSTVPDVQLKSIWNAVTRSQLDSLQVWKAFAQSENGNRNIIPDHHKRVRSMDFILQQVPSSPCAWITTLDIFTDELSNADLVRVSELCNLRRCHLATGSRSATGKVFNDRMLKSWAEQAQQKGAFAHLQSIFLYGQEGITHWSLDQLQGFPALDEFCASRCTIARRETCFTAGWQLCSKTGFVAFVKSSQDSRHIDYSWSWNELVAEYFNVRIVASDDPVDRCPILNMSIGEPENRMGSLEEMVYLRRCIDKVPGEDQESQALPLPVTSTAGPSMKKRKLTTGLAALMDMM